MPLRLIIRDKTVCSCEKCLDEIRQYAEKLDYLQILYRCNQPRGVVLLSSASVLSARYLRKRCVLKTFFWLNMKKKRTIDSRKCQTRSVAAGGQVLRCLSMQRNTYLNIPNLQVSYALWRTNTLYVIQHRIHLSMCKRGGESRVV